MPIFEYRCTDCGFVTEVLVNTADKPKPNCGHCGSNKTVKLFSTFSAQVKESAPPARGSCCECSNSSCPHAGR